MPGVFCGADIVLYEGVNGAAVPRKYKISADQIVPVPPHGRLIDADALIIALETQDYSCAPDTLDDWTPMDMTKAEIADIKAAPTIIQAEEE